MKFHLIGNDELISAVKELKEFGIELADDGVKTTLKQGDSFQVTQGENQIEIVYQKKVQIFYALKTVSDGESVEGNPAFENLTYMCDCSRNAVAKLDTLKTLARYLAVMGYDSLGLYMEDTFELEGYPYFGYLRTPYKRAELKELDGYCARFGVELVPYIQTLAHFNSLVRHYAMDKLFDTGDILLVGEERTYEFIEAIIKTCSECFTTRSINIGMDEAYMLGRGKYQDRNGFRPRFDIMLEHLVRVLKICTKYGLRPMMWSDMFFAQSLKTQYGAGLPKELLQKVPKEVELIYWDYSETDEAHYKENLKRHRMFGNEIGFAGGACKWHGFTPDNRNSFRSCYVSMRACKKQGIKRYIVTGWGDNGGECSQFSTLPTLLYCSRLNYGKAKENAAFKHSFLSLTGMPFADFMSIDLNNRVADDDGLAGRNTANKYLLFNDVLLGTLDTTVADGLNERYAAHAQKLKRAVRRAGRWQYVFETQYRLAQLLSIKAELGIKLRRAYQAGDKETLNKLYQQLPLLGRRIEVFYTAFANQWHLENRANGFDVQDIRIGALKQRLHTATTKLKDYLAGKISEIPELEESLLDHMGGGNEFEVDPDQCEYRWRRMTSVNVND